jgi:hypothetical protein
MRRKLLAIVAISLASIAISLVSVFPNFKDAHYLPQPQWSIPYNRVPTYVITGSVATAHDEGAAVVQTNDGGYAIAGVWHDRGYAPHSGGVDNYTGVIVKTDSLGQVQWEKALSTHSGRDSRSIIQTRDSGFLLSTGGGLIKMDSEGTVEWSKNFDPHFYSLLQSSDGGYVCVGFISAFFSDGVVLKIDENGNQLWNVTFSSDATYYVARGIVETANGGYAVVLGGGESMLAVIDAEGGLKSNYTYQVDTEIFFNSIAKNRNGGYLLAGGTSSGGADDQGLGLLVKVDSQGEMEWHQTYEYPPWKGSYQSRALRSVVQIDDGTYVTLGNAGLVKMDATGDVQWNLYDFDAGIGEINSLVATEDGGFAVVGSLNGSIWLAKFAPQPVSESSWLAVIIIAVVAAVVISAEVTFGVLFFLKRKRGRLWENKMLTLSLVVILMVSVLFVSVLLYSMEWSRTYSNYSGDQVIQTADGGYAIVGMRDLAPLLIKTGIFGERQWEKMYGPEFGIDLSTADYWVAQTKDLGYVLSGSSGWLLKTDPGGNVQWSKSFDCYFLAVIQASDGGYVLAGEAMNDLMGGPDAFLLKTDDQGNQLWNKTFSVAPNLSRISAVVETANGGFAVTGERGYAWFALTDSEGNLIVNRSFSQLRGWLGSIDGTIDGGFVLAGGTYTGGVG